MAVVIFLTVLILLMGACLEIYLNKNKINKLKRIENDFDRMQYVYYNNVEDKIFTISSNNSISIRKVFTDALESEGQIVYLGTDKELDI